MLFGFTRTMELVDATITVLDGIQDFLDPELELFWDFPHSSMVCSYLPHDFLFQMMLPIVYLKGAKYKDWIIYYTT